MLKSTIHPADRLVHRWYWLVSIGLLVSLPGCGRLTNKKAVAVLKVSREMTQGNDADFQIYKETQAALIKSQFVVQQAMRSPALQSIRVTQPQISSALRVDSGETELLEVSLRQGSWDPKQTTTILESVLKAYQSEVVNKERLEKVEILRKLRLRYAKVYDQVGKQTDEITSLAKNLEITDGRALEVEHDLKLQRLQLLQKRLIEAELDAVAEGSSGSDSGDSVKATPRDQAPEPESDVEVLFPDEAPVEDEAPDKPEENVTQNKIALLQKLVREQSKSLVAFNTGSAALEVRKDALLALRRDMETVRTKMQQLESEIDGPDRVSVIQAPVLQ